MPHSDYKLMLDATAQKILEAVGGGSTESPVAETLQAIADAETEIGTKLGTQTGKLEAIRQGLVAVLGSVVRHDAAQTLTDAEKAQARTNIGAAKESEVVKIVAQTLTEAEKAQVRANIDAADASDVVHLTGSESVSGVKTFTDAPIVPTQAIEDFSQKAASTAFVQTKVRSEVDQLQAQLNALEGAVLTATENSAVAYSKAIPTSANLFKYAAIRNYGGRSLAWNQFIEDAYSFTFAAGTARQQHVKRFNAIAGHKYVFTCRQSATLTSVTRNTFYIEASTFSFENTSENYHLSAGYRSWIWTATTTEQVWLGFLCNAPDIDVTYDKFQATDLTLAFGAGNEPSTVEEFRAMFPDAYYAYTEGEIKSAGVNKIVSKDSNSDVLAEMNIPAEILALPGYGWSAGTAKNWVDWENKKYIQEVAKIDDISTLVWTIQASSETQRIFRIVVPGMWYSGTAVENADAQLLCPKYVGRKPNTIYSFTAEGIANAWPEAAVWLYDSTLGLATADQAKAANVGVPLLYALETPIETDISALIDDNTIEVESGGSLTFENTNGDSYRIPVPSSVVTMEKP